ncbi:winged helix-turn-helix transcriptional regulator [Clostridium sp. D2Q-11]|uniref:Winged helix-turn-helix transcriptional regulator n=1 Tax=Anaeromonas frigoriresistens TaxID=2683708 RepID=A0A942UVL4_9FIRM|nr:PfkB family carbohydrate kinase [Anaeromonas frigoriresistens]MBS4540059.1 winged helix-turn-helix transcriptional regulator [Anaeromonas frigoriresistens]
MTDREKEILNLIRENPLISQQELADILSIKRSSVAVHITNLIKKGLIKGRGYILNTDDIVVIGGSNIDLQGFSYENLIPKDSNPGEIKLSVGGVGRNIAENLSLLGMKVNFISAVGNDIYGKKILNELQSSGISTNNILVTEQYPTSTYLSILDSEGDMNVAISSMEIFNEITIDLLREKSNTIKNSKGIILDTNLPKETLEYIVNHYGEKDIFIDTVSTTKSLKIKEIIDKFHTIKPNKYEAEILSGIEIRSKEDLERAGNYFLSKGVKNIIITLGEDGVYYKDQYHSGHIPSPEIEVINATGAGDAFMAALIYGHYNNWSIKDQVIFSIGGSILAMSDENTVNRNVSVNNISKLIKEMKIC